LKPFVIILNLTIINVVFLPLNLIASIGGMSEFSMMTKGFNWRIAYMLLSLAMLILGWATWWWLTRVSDQRHLGGAGRN